MAAAELNTGLSPAILADLAGVFARYPEIRQVLLYGSRAKGSWKPGSDIDLAVLAPEMSEARFAQLWCDIDDLPLIFKVDCLHWDRLGNLRLKEKILAEGVEVFRG